MVRDFKRILNVFAALALVLWAAALYAEPRLELEIMPRSGTLDDIFLFSVVIENGGAAGGAPLLKGGGDFEIDYIGPRNEIKIVNGEMHSRLSHNYRLAPKKEGMLETPQAQISLKGKTLSAPALKVKISRRAAPGGAGNGAAPDALGSEPVFFRQSVDQNPVYVGQQLVNSLELYSRVNVLRPQVLDLSFDDFLNIQLGKEARSQRVVNGEHYDVTSLRYAIFPLRSGKLLLPERRIQAQIPSRRTRRFPFGSLDPFGDDFFGGFFSTMEYQEKTVRSNSIELEVRPLPPPPPGGDDWRLGLPLVGTTELKLMGSSDAVKVGDSKTLVFQITSLGNLNGVNSIPLDLGEKARVYQENPESKPIYDPVGLLTQKTFKLSVVALEGGIIEIPALRLLYFDPHEERYKVARSKPLSFEVTGKALQTSRLRPETHQEADYPAAVKRPAKPTYPPYFEETFLERLSQQITLSLALLVLGALTALLYIVSLIRRSRRAGKPKREAMAAIRKASNAGDLQRAFEAFIQQHLKIDERTRGEPLKAVIQAKVRDENLRFALQAILDDFDRLRYSGQGRAQETDLSKLRQTIEEALAESNKW